MEYSVCTALLVYNRDVTQAGKAGNAKLLLLSPKQCSAKLRRFHKEAKALPDGSCTLALYLSAPRCFFFVRVLVMHGIPNSEFR